MVIEKLYNFVGRFVKSPTNSKIPTREETIKSIVPGRVSVPNDTNSFQVIKGLTELVTPSYRVELIPLIRDLYKVNPDVSIAVQDMFKLTNTGHRIVFPNNTDEQSTKMREHLTLAGKRWSTYSAGIDGLVNKMIVQCLIGGAVSIEAVPNIKLDGVSTILFINPEDIIFNRLVDGVYHPYQKNYRYDKVKDPYIKLNTETYKYSGMFNDTDEPYGIPPFISALDSIKTQADMKVNMKQILEIAGLMGFLEVKMDKPARLPSENDGTYVARLQKLLADTKSNLFSGMRDGIVTGFKDDHDFKMNSTSKDFGNIDKPWSMNQQSLANGLGVNGTIIGVNSTTSEGAAGILLSKMISQLKNIQMIVASTLEFIYTLELRLAGFNCKGISVQFAASTISDEMKVQQGLEYKLRNLTALYNQGIISQYDFAFETGYGKPDKAKPRAQTSLPGAGGTGTGKVDPAAKKEKREKDKDTSDRKTRDKNKTIPKRKDQNPKP